MGDLDIRNAELSADTLMSFSVCSAEGHAGQTFARDVMRDSHNALGGLLKIVRVEAGYGRSPHDDNPTQRKIDNNIGNLEDKFGPEAGRIARDFVDNVYHPSLLDNLPDDMSKRINESFKRAVNDMAPIVNEMKHPEPHPDIVPKSIPAQTVNI